MTYVELLKYLFYVLVTFSVLVWVGITIASIVIVIALARTAFETIDDPPGEI